jgi:hypothetical protein
MFICVSATLAKGYSGKFHDGNSVPVRAFATVTQTFSEWSEQIGRYLFTKSVASATKVLIYRVEYL